MKKLTFYSIACLAVGIILSSCQSNLSITKRHYTNGYYVDFGKSNKSLAENKTPSVPAEVKPVTPVSSVNVIANKPAAQSKSKELNEVSIPATNPSGVSKALKIKKTLGSMPFIGTPEAKKSAVSVNENVANQKLATDSVNKISDDEPARAALSLLWIVIVVILILWLIGILAGGFGLGGFINLLLVIALILLILWLLRVV